VKPTPLYLNAALKLSSPRPPRVERPSKNTFPIPPSLCPSAAAPAIPSALQKTFHGSSGSSTTSAEFPAVRCHLLRLGHADRADENQRQPIANLIASTSGTDSDWVVKLIDLYPDEVGAQQEMAAINLWSPPIFSVAATAKVSKHQGYRAR